MATAAGVDSSAAELMLDLSAARHSWLARNAVLLLLKSGQMVIAHLTIQAGMVTHIKVSPHTGTVTCGLLSRRLQVSCSVSDFRI